MTHDYHEGLEGYDARQILHDGCAECEARGKDVARAMTHLDSMRFARAWRRAYDVYATRGSHDVGRTSEAEGPLLAALWTVQVQLERRGVKLTGQPPAGEQALTGEPA